MTVTVTGGMQVAGGAYFGPQVLDPYYGQVVLLLNFDGLNGSQTIVDQSQYADATGVCVGTSALSTAQTLFGSTTFALNGSNNSGVQFNDSPRFTLGSGEFCIEMWYRPTDAGFGDLGGFFCGQGPFDQADINTSFRMYLGYTGTGYGWRAERCVGAVPVTIAPSGNAAAATWYHVAYYRVGINTYLAVDGVIVGSVLGNVGVANDSAYKLGVGCMGERSSGYIPTGFMGPFRMTVGAGRYPETNFTPPTGPFPTS
jgi:hypothetical protein